MVQRELTALTKEFGASPGTGALGTRWFETSGPEGHSLMAAVTPLIHVHEVGSGLGRAAE